MSNAFDRAVKAGLSKHSSYKQYLLKSQGVTESEASAELFRQQILYAARKNENLHVLSQEEQDAVIAELIKADSIITPESIAAAIVTVQADTAIEQKSWWSAFKSFLGL
jgi:hypothetical protein